MIPGSFLRLVVLWLVVLAAGVMAFFAGRTFAPAERSAPLLSEAPSLVTTLAGEGAPGDADGEARTARFADPWGVAIGPDGTVYVADAAENNRIRAVAGSGRVSTLAGGVEGFLDGAGSAAAFNTPSGLAIDSAGTLYVADTGNHAIRSVSPDGRVATVAGNGLPGYQEGRRREAQFNGPTGVAVDGDGIVYVADTYNDRIRKIDPDGVVTTIAGSGAPGYLDGIAAQAQFDTPSGLTLAPEGVFYVADTGNDAIRIVTRGGQVETLGGRAPSTEVHAPIGVAVTPDGVVYVAQRQGTIVQLGRDGSWRTIAGAGPGFADGTGTAARFGGPAGLAADPGGALLVADAGNYLVRRIAPRDPAGGAVSAPTPGEAPQHLPHLDAETLKIETLPWPLDPQEGPHEIAGTLGEPRGSFRTDGRERFHAGLDVRGDYGATVRIVRDEKVVWPLSVSGFGGLNETLTIGAFSYTHLRVGRDRRDRPIDPARFALVAGPAGRPARVRIRRGTRFRVGDAIGTINRAVHTHVDVGPRGAEVNPLSLPLVGFVDTVAPRIAPDGIRLFDERGRRFSTHEAGRLLVHGDVRIVVDAYDQVDGNAERRRLGLYRLGYQVLMPDGNPAVGYDTPRMTMEFDRMAGNPAAPSLAYDEGSGITAYGHPVTRFLYIVTNTMRQGDAAPGIWRTSELPVGDYLLRIIARDRSGNEADEGSDLPITIIDDPWAAGGDP